MTCHRVLAIGLDGFELSLAEALMANGELPALSALRERSARFLLDHGSAKRTGLAWEHVSTGLSPSKANRFAAVSFDPIEYSVWQDGTALPPFVKHLAAHTVVFDAPYFDLAQADTTEGLVGWGAHDPGVAPRSHPQELWSELSARFGQYPAEKWIYGFAWPCPSKSQTMAQSLVKAVDTRAAVARWLLADRLPDWDLALVVVSELHSAVEALWHGTDAKHPLHHLPSAIPAREGLKNVYRAVDRLIGTLVAEFGDATIVTFAAHGMGPNESDVASMLLLSELLYRDAFKHPLLREPREWADARNGLPLLGPNETWSGAVSRALGERDTLQRVMRKGLRRVSQLTGAKLGECEGGANMRMPLDWMPAASYRRYWPRMKAFALPSFYDGRVRINLVGREKHGIVAPEQYAAACDDVETLLWTCRDSRTGDTVVRSIDRCGGVDPAGLGPTESDLIVEWNSSHLGFDHPSYGRIGPIPYRRTGGHTGKYGFAYMTTPRLEPGDYGNRSTFDVVPTLIDFLGQPIPSVLSGTSLLAGSGMRPAGMRAHACDE